MDSAPAALCAAGDGATPIALVVPQYVVAAYNAGQLGAAGCRRPSKGNAYELISASDVPALDHPLLRVHWRGQSNRKRDTAIDRFRDWLRDNLPQNGFEEAGDRSLPGPRAADFDSTLDSYFGYRKRVSVVFLLDTSNSMGKQHVRNGTSLDRGRRLIREALDRLGDRDMVGLWSFPGDGAQAREVQQLSPVREDQLRAVQDKLAGLNRARGSSPVFAGTVLAAQQTAPVQDAVIVVVTDGDDWLPSGSRYADRTAEDVKQATKGGAGLRILAVGVEQCAEADLQPLRDRCVDAANDSDDQIVGRLLRSLRIEGAQR
ncbi:VWA domain-containing protein [Actinomadura keratinilytica]|uniref:VWFA domain-containing protein n=1 Tax=Actinomadura keratinilytica TaxID=547461 RepID=A0ABP7Z4V4_9ACTN